MRPHRAGEPGLDASETTERVDIGGRSLALTRSGKGPVTVILETGLGAESCEWAAVRQGVSSVARVFSYDRANRGSSDPAPRPRPASAMVDDLEVLIDRAGLPPPYILVGHSFGGLLMRIFADRHAHQVAGLLLVDSLNDRQFDVFGPLFPPPTASDPPQLQETRAFWTGGWRDAASTPEGIDFPTSLAEGRAITALGDIPLVVISAGTFLNQPMMPAAFRSLLQERWDELQGGFLGLSTRAEIIGAPLSGHFVQRDDPLPIIKAIKMLVADAGALPASSRSSA